MKTETEIKNVIKRLEKLRDTSPDKSLSHHIQIRIDMLNFVIRDYKDNKGEKNEKEKLNQHIDNLKSRYDSFMEQFVSLNIQNEKFLNLFNEYNKKFVEEIHQMKNEVQNAKK